MKLGMPTLIEYDDFRRNVELCRKLSLDFIEINLNLPYCGLDKIVSFVQNNREMMAGIGITIHLPEEIDIAIYQKSIRKGFLECIKEAVGFSNELNAAILNLHISPGVYFTLPDRKEWINEKYGEEFLGILSGSLAEINALAKNSTAKICFENTKINKYALDCFNEIVKYDSLFCTWDIGHDASSGYLFSGFAKKNASKIAHMHIHDYDGKKDHNPIYSGNIKISEYLNFADEKGLSAVIEVKTSDALEESVKRIRERERR